MSNPRSVTESEGPFLDLELTIDDQARLIEDFRELGYKDPKARGAVSWLVVKKTGLEDLAASDTKAEYRKMFAHLQSASGPRGKGRKARLAFAARRGERGMADILAIVGISSSATAAVLHEPAAAGAVLASLVITRTGSDELPLAA